MKNWIKPAVLASYTKMDLVLNEASGDWMYWVNSWGYSTKQLSGSKECSGMNSRRASRFFAGGILRLDIICIEDRCNGF